MDNQTVVLFVRDLFPLGPGSIPENSVAVAKAVCMVQRDEFRGTPEFENFVNSALEWQGEAAPRQGFLDRLRGRPARPLRGEAEFRHAARAIVARWNLLDEDGYFRADWESRVPGSG